MFFFNEYAICLQSVVHTIHILFKDKTLKILWEISKTPEKSYLFIYF